MGTVICDRSAGKDKLFRAKPNYRGGTPRFRLPILYFLPMALCLWLAARLGVFLRTRRPLQEDEQADFGVIQAATLTLLALIIGFSFSMATSRYDVRKSYEQAEANAIGTEWVRAGLLPPGDTAKVLGLLRQYVLVGYGAHRAGLRAALVIVLSSVIAISFLLIADIDAPCGELIRVKPQNLVSPAQSLPRQ